MTPTAEAQPVASVVDRAAGYGIPGEQVDGNDPDAVHRALGQAVSRAREGGGPTLLECMTYRLWGHYFGDPMRYIPPEELEAARQAEPVARYRSRLIDDGVLDEAGGGPDRRAGPRRGGGRVRRRAGRRASWTPTTPSSMSTGSTLPVCRRSR